jgi:hypothetical protein
MSETAGTGRIEPLLAADDAALDGLLGLELTS